MASESKMETVSDSESERDEELKATKQTASKVQWYELENYNLRSVQDVCLSFDRKLIAACGAVDEPKDQICVWSLEEGSQGHMRLHVPGRLFMKRVCFSPDNKRLACTNGIDVWMFSLADAKQARLLDPSSDEGDDEDFGDDIDSIFFSTDGNLLAAKYESTAVKMWNVATAKRYKQARKRADWMKRPEIECEELECMPPILSVQFDDPDPTKSSYAKIPVKAPLVDK